MLARLTAKQALENNRRAKREWYLKNKARKLELDRQLRLKNPERYRDYVHTYYKKHKEKILKRIHARRKANPEEARKRYLYYYYKNREKFLAFKEENEKKPKCIGCTALLKDYEEKACIWCLTNYPQKYANI